MTPLLCDAVWGEPLTLVFSFGGLRPLLALSIGDFYVHYFMDDMPECGVYVVGLAGKV